AYAGNDPEIALLTDAFGLLRAAAAVISQNPTARMRAITLTEENPTGEILINGTRIILHTKDEWGFVTPTYPGYAVVIEDGEDAAYLLGRGFWITLEGGEGTTPSFLSATAFELEGAEP